MKTLGDWDFSGYVLDRVMVDEYDFNWKTFIEVYLEVYHVDPFHPGLGNFTDCNNFAVDYGADWSVQIVQAKAGLEKPGTPVYRKWHEACLQVPRRPHAQAGRAVDDLFPGPDAGVVPERAGGEPPDPALADAHHQRGRVLLPRGDRALRARVHRGAAGRLRGDRDRGRRDLHAHGPRPPRLWEEGRDDAGPYQSPMEDTMVHFHEWVRQGLAR